MGRKTIISITVDTDVGTLLPSIGRSGFINGVLRQHFKSIEDAHQQVKSANNDESYTSIKEKLMGDLDFTHHIKMEAVQAIMEEKGF